jgi:hypothetical protein
VADFFSCWELEVAERVTSKAGAGKQSWGKRSDGALSKWNVEVGFLARAGAVCFAGAISACAGGSAIDLGDLAQASDGMGASIDGADPSGTAEAALSVDGGAASGDGWQRSIGSNDASVSSGGVAAAGDGGAFVTGTTDGAVGGPNQGLSDAYVAKYSAQGELLWAEQLGSAGDDTSSGVSAASDGSVFIAGATSGALDGVALGFGDAFVARYSSSGVLEWTRQLGTTQPDAAFSVSAAASGDVLVAGSTRGTLEGRRTGSDADALVASYSTTGELLWARQLGSAPGYDDVASGVSVDGDGNVLIAGHTFGDLADASGGSADAFVAKYSAAGELLWSEQLGAAGYDAADAVSVDESGNVYVAGQLGGTRVGGPGVIIPGEPFVAKLSPDGELLWEQRLADAAVGAVTSVSTDVDGQVFAAGYTTGAVQGDNQGLYDTFVVGLSSAGERLGALQLGVAEKDQATGVSAATSGDLFISHDVTSPEAEAFDRSFLTRTKLNANR